MPRTARGGAGGGRGAAHWTAHLHALGHDVVGVEPIPEFVAHAHRAHPGVRVEPSDHRVTTAWPWLCEDLGRPLTDAGFAVVDQGARQDPACREHGWIETIRG